MAQVEAETTLAEELQQKRLDRAKAMVGWKREEPNQVFSLQVAEVLAEALETSEDVLRGLAVAKFADADTELVNRMRSKLRKMHQSVKDQYLKASVANRMGVQAVSKIFKPTGYDGMTPEQEKATQAYIKEQQDGGRKWKKSGGGGKGAVLQPVATAAEIYPVPGLVPGYAPGVGPLQWQGQYGPQQQSWGWQAPLPQTMQGSFRQPSGQGRADRKAKFPCDNCGQLGHRKYQPVCPNYHIHLESLQQAAAAYRGGQGTTAGQGDAGLMPPGTSVVPYTGRIFFRSFSSEMDLFITKI
jgi:hypothetical protein